MSAFLLLVLGDALEQESFLEELSTNWRVRKIGLKGEEKAGSERTPLVKRSCHFQGKDCVPATRILNEIQVPAEQGIRV